MKKFFKIVLWVVIAIVFIGTFVFLFLNSKPKVTTYALVSPTDTSIERTTVLTGKIEPRDEIDIKPQISGIISEINVEPGDMVHAGDVIARIKVIPEASSLSSAQSRVENFLTRRSYRARSSKPLKPAGNRPHAKWMPPTTPT